MILERSVAIVRRVQAALEMRDWSISVETRTAAQLSAIIPEAIAICRPMPTRSMATLLICDPWPAGESLDETIAHEITHALLSPLTALIPSSDAAVMIEESIVEKLGKAIATTPALARAIGQAVNRYAPTLRARLRARRDRMDPEKIKSIITALKEGNGEAALGLLEELLTAAVAPGSGATDPPPAREGDAGGTEADPATPPPARGYGREEEPAAPMGRSAARRGSVVAEQELRARRTADKAVGIYIRGRIGELRQGGLMLDAALEAELARMTDDEAFDRRISDIERGRALGAGTQQRARSGAQLQGAPPPADSGALPPMTAEQLRAEGASEQWITDYAAEHKSDPRAAAASLAGFRARKAQDARGPWAKNGARS